MDAIVEEIVSDTILGIMTDVIPGTNQGAHVYMSFFTGFCDAT